MFSEGGQAARGGAADEVIVDSGPEHCPRLSSELLRAEAGNVHADSVTMEGSGAEQITAERLVMTNSGARSIEARSAQVERSGVLLTRSDKAVFNQSSIVAAAASEARVVKSAVLLLKADEVTVEGEAKIGILAGPGCQAVRPLVDTQGAAAFGAAVGVVMVLLGAIMRRVVGRR